MAERGLFRWAGAKRHLVDLVAPMIRVYCATTGGRLISLFHGSGAIERAVGGAAVAADGSPELLNLFSVLQSHKPETVHEALVKFDSEIARTPEAYKQLGLEETWLDPLYGATRFIWLSAMQFNGVWRVNARGQMNMGVDRARLARAPEDVLPGLEAFRAFAHQIRSTQFVRGWETALEHACPGDLLFADPPYGEFVGYTAGGFSAKDQRLLAAALRGAVTGRGCALIAFNAPVAAAIYHWARVEEVTRSGCVSSKPTARDPVTELVITAGLRGAP